MVPGAGAAAVDQRVLSMVAMGRATPFDAATQAVARLNEIMRVSVRTTFGGMHNSETIARSLFRPSVRRT